MKLSFASRINSLQPSAIDEILKYCSDPNMITFAGGIPAPESFPVEAIQEISQNILQEHPVSVLQYHRTEGYLPLRKHLQQTLVKKWDLHQPENELLITSGAQQGIDLMTRIFCSDGDVILCESPSYLGALDIFRANGAALVGIPVESDGISISALEEAMNAHPSAKLLYLIPNFQNPLGITMSLQKRKLVYQLAKKYRVVIVEDDPYGELYFSGTALPPIKAFDEEGVVVYCGSFSKIVSPGFRIGYLYGNRQILAKITTMKQCNDLHTNVWSQMVLHEYLTRYPHEAHVQKLRELYRTKAEWMLSSLEQYFPTGTHWTHPNGGMFLWCTLPDSVDMPDFCRRAALEKKVAVVPGNAFLTDQNVCCHSFRMNYSASSKEEITSGVSRLGELLESLLTKSNRV